MADLERAIAAGDWAAAEAGLRRLAGRARAPASVHYNLAKVLIEAGKPELDEEIGDAIRLTKGGEIVNERLKGD